MTSKIRVGVIGSGVGRAHVRGYSCLPDVEVVALAALDRERAESVAREYEIPRLYADHRELLEQPDIDAVSVCVPNYLHAPVCHDAMMAGKDVLCEKPLARTADEAASIAEAAERMNQILMVMFNYRYRPDSQTVKRFIDDGALGDLYYVKAGWMRGSGIPGLGSWFTRKAQSGGGPVIDLGVHMIDLALWFLGFPKIQAVTGTTYAELGPRGRGNWKLPNRWLSPDGETPFDVEDLAAAFVRLEGGRTLVIEASWASYSSYEDDFYVHVYGNDGGAEMDVHKYTTEDTLRLFKDMAGEMHVLRPVASKAAGLSGSAAVTAAFIKAIRERRAVTCTPSEALAGLRIIDALYLSAAEGREVRLE